MSEHEYIFTVSINAREDQNVDDVTNYLQEQLKTFSELGLLNEDEVRTVGALTSYGAKDKVLHNGHVNCQMKIVTHAPLEVARKIITAIPTASVGFS